MKLTIVSPEKTIFAGEVISVVVPGARGEFEILENHAPIISSLKSGKLTYKAKTEVSLSILSGFIDVANNEVSICVEIL